MIKEIICYSYFYPCYVTLISFVIAIIPINEYEWMDSESMKTDSATCQRPVYDGSARNPYALNNLKDRLLRH